MSYRIVTPILNEEKYIRKFLKSFPEKHLPYLILVDDGSDDKTAEIIKTEYPKVTRLKHKINLGKGKSLETGALKAIHDKADIIIFMDGDMQHDPKDISRFLRIFQKHPEVDIVFGARKMSVSSRLVPFVGNKLITIFINILFGCFLNDTQCGFRAFRSKVFNKIRWESHGYSIETEMIINASKHNLKYKELTIDTIYLEGFKGTNMFDGIVILLKIMGWRILKLFK